MLGSTLDILIYRNLFSITELGLDIIAINIKEKDKRFRIRDSLVSITRRQKNRIQSGLVNSKLSMDKKIDFIVGCFMENTEKLKSRINIQAELNDEIKKLAKDELDAFTQDCIENKLKRCWEEELIHTWSQEKMTLEVMKWKKFSK